MGLIFQFVEKQRDRNYSKDMKKNHESRKFPTGTADY